MATQYHRAARKPRFGQLVVALAALLRALSSSPAHADEPPRVVMLTRGEPSTTGERVRAELAAMGFAIVLDEETGREPTRDGLAELAQARDAMAAVALRLSPDGVDMWIVEPAKRETRLRGFVSVEHGTAQATLALHAAELLRSTLLAIAPAPTGAPDAAPPELPAVARQSMPAPARAALVAGDLPPSAVGDGRAATLRLGTGWVKSAGGLGAFPSIELAAKLWLTERLGAELAALLPLASMVNDGSEGTSTTRLGALSLVVATSIPTGSRDWVWDVGAGIAGVVLQTRGAPASAAYTPEENLAAALAPLLRSGVSYSLTRGLRLGVAASLGVTVPRFLIVHAGRTAATWGLPFAMGGLALEVDVP